MNQVYELTTLSFPLLSLSEVSEGARAYVTDPDAIGELIQDGNALNEEILEAADKIDGESLAPEVSARTADSRIRTKNTMSAEDEMVSAGRRDSDFPPDFGERVRMNQQKLSTDLKDWYDFIVCGSGSSGSVVAARLAENPEVSVLLLEAGGSDDIPRVMEPGQWPLNLGTDRDWAFQAQPSPHRSIPMNMGKVLGGGSSINVMAWARGHKNDWDYFASEAGDPTWSYESVLSIYRRIEDWHGAPDPKYRGTGGPVFVQLAPDPNPVAPAMVEAARSIGSPTFENQNGRMMEGAGGSSIADLRIRDGKRQSVFRSYTFPRMDRPNLTVLTHALVTRKNSLPSWRITFQFRAERAWCAGSYRLL